LAILSWILDEIFGLWIGKLPVIVLLTAIRCDRWLDLVLPFLTPLGTNTSYGISTTQKPPGYGHETLEKLPAAYTPPLRC